MDRQFDFRALLLQIQDRLSNDDRRRIHFLVGDIIPRTQREDVTLAGTLTLLESLFDRAVISEDDLEFLIRIFGEIQCHDGVKRLREYQLSKELSKEPPKERALTMTDVFNDNVDDDKHQTIPCDRLITVDNNFVLLYKPDMPKTTATELLLIPTEKSDIQKMTTTISSEIRDTFDESSINPTAKQKQKTFFQSLLIYCLYILFFLEIVGLIIYLWIFIRKKAPINIIENRYHQDAYIIKKGKFPDSIDGKWFNHSEDLLLTYTDRLIRIDAYVYHDDMYSIKFIYSQNKTIEHKLKNSTRLNQPILSSLNFEKGNIQEITQCYKSKNNISKQLVGLSFILTDKSSLLFGSCHEQELFEDKFSNHIFGYALGKISQHLNGFQFIWYKICPLYNQVTYCTNPDLYIIPLINFYKD